MTGESAWFASFCWCDIQVFSHASGASRCKCANLALTEVRLSHRKESHYQNDLVSGNEWVKYEMHHNLPRFILSDLIYCNFPRNLENLIRFLIGNLITLNGGLIRKIAQNLRGAAFRYIVPLLRLGTPCSFRFLKRQWALPS